MKNPKLQRIKNFLQQAPYLSSTAVSSIIGEKSMSYKTSISLMKRLAKEEPERYIYLPYLKYGIPARIYNREVFLEDDDMLELFVKALKNRCYGGKI